MSAVFQQGCTSEGVSRISRGCVPRGRFDMVLKRQRRGRVVRCEGTWVWRDGSRRYRRERLSRGVMHLDIQCTLGVS